MHRYFNVYLVDYIDSPFFFSLKSSWKLKQQLITAGFMPLRRAFMELEVYNIDTS